MCGSTAIPMLSQYNPTTSRTHLIELDYAKSTNALSTVDPKFRILYAGIHTEQGKLQALRDGIQPTTQDQKDEIRTLYEILRKGPKRMKIDDYLTQWIVLVVRAQQLAIENLSEHQICEGFIEASRNDHPTFYGQMKGRKINRPDTSIADAIYTALAALAADRPSNETAPPSELPDAFDNALQTIKALKQQQGQDSLKIRDCIRIYRETMSSSTKPQQTLAAFGVTLGNELLDKPREHASEQRKSRRDTRKCICGKQTTSLLRLLVSESIGSANRLDTP